MSKSAVDTTLTRDAAAQQGYFPVLRDAKG